MTFPTLYSISSTGKPLQWTIIAEYDYFYTIAGQIGGQLVTSEPNYCCAKNLGKRNEKSAEEQAVAEAEAKWKRKLKTDYFQNLEDVMDSSKEKYFEPMLAKVYKDRKDKISYPLILDQKLNGQRFIIKKSGVYSRKGEKVLTVPHIEEDLKRFFELNPDAILDGEGYSHEYKHELNTLMSILRKTKNISADDLEISRQKVQFWIYDGFGFAGITQKTPQFERRKAIIDYFNEEHFPEYLVLVEGYDIFDEDQLNKSYEEFVSWGYEGAMIRLNGPYKNGRSSDLLKMKPEFDSECIIIDVMEGSGNWGGAAKIFKVQWENDGKTHRFDATAVGKYEECVRILQNKREWIGRETTFLYNDLTGLGTPNFARIDVNNCFKK